MPNTLHSDLEGRSVWLTAVLKEQLNDKCFIQASFHLTDRSKYYFHYFFTSMDISLRKWQESAGKFRQNQTEPKQTQENTDDVEETRPGWGIELSGSCLARNLGLLAASHAAHWGTGCFCLNLWITTPAQGSHVTVGSTALSWNNQIRAAHTHTHNHNHIQSFAVNQVWMVIHAKRGIKKKPLRQRARKYRQRPTSPEGIQTSNIKRLCLI